MVDAKATQQFDANGVKNSVGVSGMDVQEAVDPQQTVEDFRSAIEEDIMKVLNIMSSKNKEQLRTLNYYVVPACWFVRAYPILTNRSGRFSDTWMQEIGPIPTHELVRYIADTDDTAIVDGSTGTSLTPSLKPGLVHGRDFFLLGPSAWKMVRHSFSVEPDSHSSDEIVIARPCFFLSNQSVEIAIRLYDIGTHPNDKTFEVIPPGGRFQFENMVPHTASVPIEDQDDGKHQRNIGADSVIGKNDRDNDETIINTSPASDRDANTNETGADAVPDTDDEHNEMTWEDSNVSMGSAYGPANPPAETEPILLPPPSAADQAKPERSASDDMDAESTRSQNAGSKSPSQLAGRKRFASGLGNLGNTCFMNSTIQCLAHTEPLRRYFLSGEYRNELNHDNPLGTGGELATQFANLLSDMWGVPTKRRNVMGSSYDYTYSSYTSAVYPRSFKETLGRHAEQFMGYDQHDSQELATYLLDALHEDTNRVTKKPYIEKPEQGEDEPDDVASAKAWSLHLKREDSKVLENFMGQVKSRVQCCEDGCNRVSTTFDPFMYLSVPIPGANDRTITVTFVPLDGSRRISDISVTLNKTANISTLLEKVAKEVTTLGICDNSSMSADDLIAADIWHNDVYTVWQPSNEVDRIRERDITFVYQVDSLESVQKASQQITPKKEVDQDAGIEKWKSQEPRPVRYKLDPITMRNLSLANGWQKDLEKYVINVTSLYTIFNPTRGKPEDQIRFHQRLRSFVGQCINEIETYEEEQKTRRKRSKQGAGAASAENSSSGENNGAPSEEKLSCLLDRCNASKLFHNVHSRYDVAVLEVCANKLRQFILKSMENKEDEHKNGALIQISMKKADSQSVASMQSSRSFGLCHPFFLRVPSSMTVFNLREALSKRFERCVKHEAANEAQESHPAGSTTGEKDDAIMNGSHKAGELFSDSPALNLMRKLPMTFRQRAISHQQHQRLNSPSKTLGMLSNDESEGPTSKFAMPTNSKEQELVCEVVGDRGIVYLEWSDSLFEDNFDLDEYEAKDETDDSKSEEQAIPEKNKRTTVQDCIQKYCQMEQLEDTEMWYCNRCKKHVQAWKQFHLYRAPPILIIHLKRFHYSATTHRRNKIGKLVHFPLRDLDLSGMFTQWNDEEKPIYDCYAVSNHYGGLGGGHYTAYTLGDDGTWCHYDDSRLTKNISEDEVVSDAAYVLYYRRKDVPIGQDLIVDTPMTNPVANEAQPDPCEVSSCHTEQAGSEDMLMDDRSAGSRTLSSPMPSVEDSNDPSARDLSDNDNGSGVIDDDETATHDIDTTRDIIRSDLLPQ